MLARERLTGLKPPAGAERLTELWRSFVEEKAGADLDRLGDAHSRPARLRQAGAEAPDARSGMASEFGGGRRGLRERRGEQAAGGAGRSGRRGRGEPVRGLDAARGGRRHVRRRRRGRDGHGRGALGRARGRGRRGRRRGGGRKPPVAAPAAGKARAGLQGLSPPKFDEIVDADELCDPDELQRLREYLDKQLQNLSSVVAAPRQPAAAAPDGEAEPRVGVRPRRGHARQRPPAARRHRPAAALVLQAGKGHGVPRHRGDAAPRQFGLDARAPDHGRGDLRRHSRPHARALRGQGRDSRLHHPRLEGRAVARGLAAGGQAAQSRPAQRHAPRHLQGRPTRPGGGRARTSA